MVVITTTMCVPNSPSVKEEYAIPMGDNGHYILYCQCHLPYDGMMDRGNHLPGTLYAYGRTMPPL